MITGRLNKLLLPFSALLFLIMAACADYQPDNLEPIIEMLPATEITRTQAVISARIQKRGSTPLSYLTFHYGEDGNTDMQKSASDPDAETVSILVSDLKPGTSYTCYIEGGTASASLRSETVSFTTLPNTMPVVSLPKPLSTGPTSIIIEFEITDDGGEALTGAGCDVANVSTGQSQRINLPSDCLSEGLHRLVIGKLAPLSSFTITPFASNSIGESRGESFGFMTKNSIVLSEGGTLSALYEGTSDIALDRLAVSGNMNGDDFRFLRAILGAPTMPDHPAIDSNVSEIDLSDVRIVAGGGTYDGSRLTENDKVTTNLLADCSRLRVALLPASATVIERNALARCPVLESLTVPAGVVTLIPSVDCPSLRTIDVSAGNPNFTSVDGVLFNHDITDILWFPPAKTGVYTIPSNVTKISENAFIGARITGLIVPSSVRDIGYGAFAGSSLTEITLPDSNTNVPQAAFQGCTGLVTVRLGAGTQYIGNYAFDNTALKDLYVGAPVPPFVDENAFFNRGGSVTGSCVLHVPEGYGKLYRNHAAWGLFERIEEYKIQ